MMRKGKKTEKKKKLEIVFDPKSRREFLTGFRKRKNERKKRAKEELERLIKDENKRIKQEIKDGIQKQLKRSFQSVPEIEHILKEDEEIENDEAIVTIKEISIQELAEKENILGQNYLKYDIKDEKNENTDDDDIEMNQNDNSIPGMNLNVENNKVNILKNNDIDKSTKNELKTKKDVNKVKQKQMIKFMKHNKFYKIKQNYDRIMNKKKAKQNRNKQIKQLKKEGKKNPKKYIAIQNAKRKDKEKMKNRRR